MTALLALGSSLLWGGADFLGGTATRRLSAWSVIGGSQALALLALVPIAIATGGLAAPLGYLPWSLAAGLVGLVALAAFYHALAAGTMGVVAPIASTSIVVPVAVGLWRGDAPSGAQLAGIAATGVGVVLASGPRRGPAAGGAGPADLRPLVLAGLAAGGFGLVVVFLAEGARHSVVMTLVAMRAETVVLLALLALARVRRWPAPGRNDLPMLAAIGGGDAAANGAYAAATTSGDLSVVAVLSSLYPAVTVLLARQVHGERLRPLQVGGVLVVLAGVLLIAAGGGTG